MTIHEVDLPALISTRICHDLINPIGAINNGLELLDAVGTAPGPELSLVNDSASAATAKLNVFRLAFGEAAATAEVQGERVSKLISDMYDNSRMEVDWHHGIWSFKATGRRFNIRQELWDMVTGQTDPHDTSASDVHFLLARMTADQGQRSIKLHESESELIVMVTNQ